MATVTRPWPRSAAKRLAQPAIRAERLGKRFGNLWAVHDLNLCVEAGEVFGLLGPDNAGKSTTMKLLLGLIQPTTGSTWLSGYTASDGEGDDQNPLSASWPVDEAVRRNLTGGEVLELTDRWRPIADPVYREKLVQRLGLDLSGTLESYSTGSRQKLALITRPRYACAILVWMNERHPSIHSPSRSSGL